VKTVIRAGASALALLGTLAATGVQAAASAPAAATAASAAKAPAAISKEELGYAVGVDMVRNFKRNEIELDIEQLIAGLRDASKGGATKMSDTEVRRVMSEFQANLRARLPALHKAQAERAGARATQFLAENKKQPGVQVLDGGLQYKVVKSGTGAHPKDTDTVVAAYRGTTLDGVEFDATQPGHPATFPLAQVIEGWKRALPKMAVGSRWTLWIPADLAYGDRGSGASIGPNELLVFDVELVAIQP